MHFLLCGAFVSPYVCSPNVKKLTTIARAVAVLMLTAAWLTASTASLVHDALHHGAGGHGSDSHGHGLPSVAASSAVAELGAADAHSAAIAGCFFCINGPLLVLLVVAVPVVLLHRFFRCRSPHHSSAIASARFLFPSLRAPPLFG